MSNIYLDITTECQIYMLHLEILKLKELIISKKRNQIKDFYYKELKNLPIKFQEIKISDECSYHLVIILVDKKIRNKLFDYLRKNNIKVNIHYIPIFYHPFYNKKKYFKNLNSIEYYNRAISLPAYYDLTKKI